MGFERDNGREERARPVSPIPVISRPYPPPARNSPYISIPPLSTTRDLDRSSLDRCYLDHAFDCPILPRLPTDLDHSCPRPLSTSTAPRPRLSSTRSGKPRCAFVPVVTFYSGEV